MAVEPRKRPRASVYTYKRNERTAAKCGDARGNQTFSVGTAGGRKACGAREPEILLVTRKFFRGISLRGIFIFLAKTQKICSKIR